MHAVVLGLGMIGKTVAEELANNRAFSTVTAVDAIEDNIHRLRKDCAIIGEVADLSSEESISLAIQGADIVVSCLPHSLSMAASKAAIRTNCHLIDLVGAGFSTKLKLHKQAEEAGVILMPGCGVAPGIVNILARRGIDLLDHAEEAVLFCGGLPRHPLPPLHYQVVFRLESLLNLYMNPAVAVEAGERVEVPPFSGLEKITFSEPVGECEAIITDAHSTAYTLKDKVDKLYEKTVRYRGHWEKMHVLAELGFLNKEPVEIDGKAVSPRDFSRKILEPSLKGSSLEDITVLRVIVEGTKDGRRAKHQWEMIDHFDHELNITSMAKTTAMPAVVLAQWLAEGAITEKGVLAIEQVITGERFNRFLNALEEVGIHITYKENTN
ncbi:saccharopine dehydrogenase family protein [Virgibacillus sp. W0430]|uniref:saccharopine dehydrogenase family protein n=1 Tax=Virgibacillus sp. W0430 TaxID=3391580 RepID=UPI003F4512FB